MLVRIQIKNKFNSSCIIVSNSFGSINGWSTNWFSYFFRNVRWSLLNNFLMSSLNRTISFIKMHVVSMLISKNLYLNMSWLCNILFNKDSVIFESFEGFSFARFESFWKIFLFRHDSHSFSSSSWNSFNENWISNFLCLFSQQFLILIFTMISWHNRNVGICHYFFWFTLTPHTSDSFRWRPNKYYFIFIALFSKSCIFRKKSKSWMQCPARRFLSNL